MNTGLDAIKTASKKTVHKSAKTAGEFIGNKIADALAKLIDNKIVKKNNLKLMKIQEMLKNYSTRIERRKNKQIKTNIIKMEHYKKSKLLNNSIVSKFVTTNGSK